MNIPYVTVEIPKFSGLINQGIDYVIFPFSPVDWAKIISWKGKLNVLCVVPDIPLCDRMCQWIPFLLPMVAINIQNQYNNVPIVANCTWWKTILNYINNPTPWGEHVDGIFIHPIIQNRMNQNQEQRNTIISPPLIRNLNDTGFGQYIDLIELHKKLFDLGMLPPIVKEKRLAPIIN